MDTFRAHTVLIFCEWSGFGRIWQKKIAKGDCHFLVICLSSAWNVWAPIGRMFMKFDIWVFFRKSVELNSAFFKSDKINDSWIKIDQPDVTCFIISLFTAQHVSDVSTSIFRSLRLIVDLFHVLYCSGSMCVGVTVWFGLGGVVSLCRPKH